MNTGAVDWSRFAGDAPPAGRVHAMRMSVRPNRYGWLLLLVLAVMLLGAMNYNNSLAYALTFLLTGAWVLALLHAYRNVRGVTISAVRASAAFAGEPLAFEVYVWNPDPRTRRRLTLRAADSDCAEQFDLAGRATHSVRLLLPTRRRGWLKLPPLQLTSLHPFGICEARSRWLGEATALVYPRPAGALSLPELPEARRAMHTGQDGGDEDFAGLRDYRAGDSLRHVAWKVLARERGLHVKRFAGGGERRVRLRRQDVAFIGELETQLSQLTAWVLAADQRGIPYSLELDDVDIVAGIGEMHRERCLQALALVAPVS